MGMPSQTVTMRGTGRETTFSSLVLYRLCGGNFPEHGWSQNVVILRPKPSIRVVGLVVLGGPVVRLGRVLANRHKFHILVGEGN